MWSKQTLSTVSGILGNVLAVAAIIGLLFAHKDGSAAGAVAVAMAALVAGVLRFGVPRLLSD